MNLRLLAESFKEFFESIEFRSIVDETKDNFTILAVPPRNLNICDNVNVHIRGTPNDFTVDFVSGSNSRLYVLLGGLTGLFGGGFFLSRGLKSLEKLNDVEAKFWAFAEMKIESLSEVS